MKLQSGQPLYTGYVHVRLNETKDVLTYCVSTDLLNSVVKRECTERIMAFCKYYEQESISAEFSYTILQDMRVTDHGIVKMRKSKMVGGDGFAYEACKEI